MFTDGSNMVYAINIGRNKLVTHLQMILLITRCRKRFRLSIVHEMLLALLLYTIQALDEEASSLQLLECDSLVAEARMM